MLENRDLTPGSCLYLFANLSIHLSSSQILRGLCLWAMFQWEQSQHLTGLTQQKLISYLWYQSDVGPVAFFSCSPNNVFEFETWVQVLSLSRDWEIT